VAGFIEDATEREKEMSRIDGILQELREKAFAEYLAGNFNRAKYTFQGR